MARRQSVAITKRPAASTLTASAIPLRTLVLALLALVAVAALALRPAEGSKLKLRALHLAAGHAANDGGDVFGAHAHADGGADPSAQHPSDADVAAAAAAHAGAPATFAPYEQLQPPGTVIHHTVAHVQHAPEADMHAQEHEAEMHDAAAAAAAAADQHAHEQHDDHGAGHEQQQQQHQADGQTHFELSEHDEIQVAKAPQSQRHAHTDWTDVMHSLGGC